MSKRVFRDRQITDYDSDDPYSAFRRPKKRKKIRKDQNKEKNGHPRQIVEDENRQLNWKECFWSKKYSNSQLKEKLFFIQKFVSSNLNSIINPFSTYAFKLYFNIYRILCYIPDGANMTTFIIFYKL